MPMSEIHGRANSNREHNGFSQSLAALLKAKKAETSWAGAMPSLVSAARRSPVPRAGLFDRLQKGGRRGDKRGKKPPRIIRGPLGEKRVWKEPYRGYKKKLKDFKIGEQIEATVVGFHDIGVLLDIGATPGPSRMHPSEMPGGEMAMRRLSVGDKLTCWAKDYKPTKDPWHKAERKSLILTGFKPLKNRVPFSELKVEQQCSGIVKAVRDYGAFVDIGAEEESTGFLLHVSQIPGGDIALSKLGVGDAIKCFIKSIDPKKKHVELMSYVPGTRMPVTDLMQSQEYRGIVKKVLDYAAFVDIGTEDWLMLHVSDIEGRDAGLQKLKVGEKITCWIKELGSEEKPTLTLQRPGRKTTSDDEGADEGADEGGAEEADEGTDGGDEQGTTSAALAGAELEVGQEHSGLVVRVRDFGAFVDIGAEKDAFVHVSELPGGDAGLEKISVGDTFWGWIKSYSPETGHYLTAYKPGTRIPLSELEVTTRTGSWTRQYWGTVTKKQDYGEHPVLGVNTSGLFLDIGAEKHGMLHSSDLIGRYFAMQRIAVGDKIPCWIKTVDMKKERVQVTAIKPGSLVMVRNLTVGQEYTGIVQKVIRSDNVHEKRDYRGAYTSPLRLRYGVSIDIGANIDPMLKEHGCPRGNQDLNKIKPGDTITSWIQSVDYNKRTARLTLCKPGTRVTLAEIKPGQEYTGYINSVMKEGVWIDIGAESQALLLASDMAYGIAEKKQLNGGTTINCRIKSVNILPDALQVLLTTKPESTTKERYVDSKVPSGFVELSEDQTWGVAGQIFPVVERQPWWKEGYIWVKANDLDNKGLQKQVPLLEKDEGSTWKYKLRELVLSHSVRIEAANPTLKSQKRETVRESRIAQREGSPRTPGRETMEDRYR